MKKHEIYEHLARVYIGKTVDPKMLHIAQKKRRKKLFFKISIIVIFIIIGFGSMTAFFSKRDVFSANRIVFSLSNSPIRIPYNLLDPYPQIKRFAIPIPKTDASRYSELNFSIRGLEEGSPGIVKVVLRNKKNEEAFYFVEGVGLKWKKVAIPLKEFDTITDWSNLSDVSFVLEAWNARKKKGIILIDDVCFAG